MPRSALLVVASVLLTSPLLAGTIRDDRRDRRYLGLATAPEYQSVGQITGRTRNISFAASGTLIADDWVLTAAHVVDPAISLEFHISGLDYRALTWRAHPNWSGRAGNGFDLGLIKLAEPISFIKPAVRYRAAYEAGRQATLVGFGGTGTGLTGNVNFDGAKRAGRNMVDLVRGRYGTILFSDFDSPANPDDNVLGSARPRDLEFITAPGDSGGGLFINTRRGPRLAGVHSFVASIDGELNSDYGDFAGGIRVSKFNHWIDAVIFGTPAGPPLDTSILEARASGISLIATNTPEPSAAISAALAAGLLLRRRRGT